MPKFQVTVADEAFQKLYDESIETDGPREACKIAAGESNTADAPDHAGGLTVAVGPHSTVEESLE